MVKDQSIVTINSKILLMKYKLTTFLVAIMLMSFRSTENTYYGTASYYGQYWTGRKTASGEIFYSDSLTAAHKYFKFGTIVKIINLSNDSVREVKINDRLPKSSKRIIDVSYGTAKELNFIGKGITKVSLDPVDTVPIKK